MGNSVYSPLKLILLIVLLLFVFLGIGTMLLIPKKLNNSSPETIPTGEQSNEDGYFVNPECKVGGCNSEICQDSAEEDAVSICIYHPNFDCYKKARCEKQSDGRCAWTQSESLVQCLENNSQNSEETY